MLTAFNTTLHPIFWCFPKIAVSLHRRSKKLTFIKKAAVLKTPSEEIVSRALKHCMITPI